MSVGIQITVNIYTEFMKMAGAPEQGILGLTEYLFTDFFHPKNQEYRSRKEKQKTYSITANHATTILLSILKCLDSMLPITHPTPLLCVCHYYEFGVWSVHFLHFDKNGYIDNISYRVFSHMC